ncbi:uncharacterized protein [Branchiostoma lanceolatum]|uniref:uncharacterized protein n=1 Tax=Branchiostoma lanceolatum TaxID=7740 RepID=UPI003454796D
MSRQDKNSDRRRQEKEEGEKSEDKNSDRRRQEKEEGEKSEDKNNDRRRQEKEEGEKSEDKNNDRRRQEKEEAEKSEDKNSDRRRQEKEEGEKSENGKVIPQRKEDYATLRQRTWLHHVKNVSIKEEAPPSLDTKSEKCSGQQRPPPERERNKSMDRAKNLDRLSRGLFPLGFFLFNLMYWNTYLLLL